MVTVGDEVNFHFPCHWIETVQKQTSSQLLKSNQQPIELIRFELWDRFTFVWTKNILVISPPSNFDVDA
jgi:hypothetical protein